MIAYTTKERAWATLRDLSYSFLFQEVEKNCEKHQNIKNLLLTFKKLWRIIIM